MNRDDIQKLLGGYATGTLTEGERKALFEEALHDQKLFDALADEEALRQLLRDPAARAELLNAAGQSSNRHWWSAWLQRPAAWAAAGSLAAALILVTWLAGPYSQQVPPRFAVFKDDGTRASLRMEAPKEEPAAPHEQPTPPRPKTERKAVRTPTPAVPPSEPSVGGVGGVPAGAVARVDADAAAKSGSAVAETVSVPPSNPMTAASAFQQTAPSPVADAGEARLQRARPGAAGFRALQPAAAPPLGAAALPPGIRYEIHQRSESGVYARVDPDLPLRATEPLRMDVEANIAGYLYAFEPLAGGGFRQLSIGPTVDPHVKHTIDLGEPAGSRKVLVVLSTQPQAAFATGAATDGATRELERLRTEALGRTRVRQKSSDSVYVISSSPSPVLLVEVVLPALN